MGARAKGPRRVAAGEEGFAVLGLVVALLLVMAAIGASFTFSSSEHRLSDEVNDAFDLRELRRAMEAQMTVKGDVICPDTDQDGLTESSCGGITVGTVPWADFGLPKRAVIDGSGAMVTYVTNEDFFVDGYDKTTMLKVEENEGGTTDDCSFVLVSHGPNRLGAILPGGTTVDDPPAGSAEAENTDDDADFIARSDGDEDGDGVPDNDFDDRVECGSPNMIDLAALTTPGGNNGGEDDGSSDETPALTKKVSLIDYGEVHDAQGTYTGQTSITFDGGALTSEGGTVTAADGSILGIELGGFGIRSADDSCWLLSIDCLLINDDEVFKVKLDDGTAASFNIGFRYLSAGQQALIRGFEGGSEIGSLTLSGQPGSLLDLRFDDQTFADDPRFDELRVSAVGNSDFMITALEFNP